MVFFESKRFQNVAFFFIMVCGVFFHPLGLSFQYCMMQTYDYGLTFIME